MLIFLSVFAGFWYVSNDNFLIKKITETWTKNNTKNNNAVSAHQKNNLISLDTTDIFLKRCIAQVEDFYGSVPTEKIYVHLDKPFYKPEETIWGKVYLLEKNYAPSLISEVAHVELLNPQGQVVQKAEIQVKNGTGTFSFDFGSVGGMYKIHAYTNWLKNEGQESMFERDVQVQSYFNPKLLLKVDFLQKGYGAGNTVEVNFEALDLAKNALKNKEVKCLVKIEGKDFFGKTFTTDQEGKALITFELPKNLKSSDAVLNLILKNETYEENITRRVPIVLHNIAVQFMPEGGEIMENINQKIAFKAIDEYGKGTDVEGEIWEEDTKSENRNEKFIGNFKSYHQGMGVFELLPNAQKTYFFRLKKPFSINIPLEKANPNKNFALSINQNFTEKTSENAVNQAENNTLKTHFYTAYPTIVYVTLQVAQKIVFTKKINALQGLNTLDIDIKNQPIGIAQVTLFDEKYIPQAERLVFLHPEKKLNIEIKTNKPQYLPREQVTLNIKTTDQNQKPISANLSLCVVNDQILNIADDKQHNIMSWLLLGSELKGQIDEPNFYFEEKNKKEKNLAKALDLVMMTHGWRKFQWKNFDLQKDKNKPYFVKYRPQKTSIISGVIVDKDFKPVPNAEVTLFTTKQAKKGMTMYADAQGRFTFFNVKPEYEMRLMAKTKQKTFCDILLDNEENMILKDKQYVLHNHTEKAIFKATQETKNKTLQSTAILSSGFSMTADAMAEEVVIQGGYCIEEKRTSVGSIIIKDAYVIASFDRAMQGRIAGVQISSNGMPGSSSNIRIRGVGSLNNYASPLIIVDGIMIQGSEINKIIWENVTEVEVMKDASSSAIYGAMAANGVILVTTKQKLNKYQNNPTQRKYTPYTSLLIVPRTNPVAKEFYAPVYANKENQIIENSKRDDFRTTIFWKGNVNTNTEGKAELKFYNADNITTYRIMAEGFGGGLIGRNENTYFTQKPLQIDAVLPPSLTQEDTLNIALHFQNNLDMALDADLQVDFALNKIKILENKKNTLQLSPKVITEKNNNKTVFSGKISFLPKEKKVFYITVVATSPIKDEKINISLKSLYAEDAISEKIDIHGKGFPVNMYFSGGKLENEFTLDIPPHLEGSLKSEFSVFNDITTDLLQAVEGIIREPYGCFEQVSSSTYPNILALQFMQETNTLKTEVKKKTLEYIEKGYKKLIAYEVKGGGFDLYGKAPANEALTAYGLLEFLDMQKVYPNVDNDMIVRTKKWLLSRKDGKGGFKNNHTYFQGKENDAQNAYIVYALARANEKNIFPEYQNAYNKAWDNKDTYQMALMAMAGIWLGEHEKSKKIINFLENEITQKDLINLSSQKTWTYSQGISNTIESVSMVGNSFFVNQQQKSKYTKTSEGLDNSPERFLKIATFLAQNRNNGMFGATQSTITALQYLTQYAKMVKHDTSLGIGNIEVWVDDKLHASVQVNPKEFAFAKKENWCPTLPIGKHTIKVIAKNLKNAMSFAGNIHIATYMPYKKNIPNMLDLTTKLSHTIIALNQTTRLTSTIYNPNNDTQISPMACIGIPSGLAVQAWQLKELQEKDIFDYYEIKDNMAFFYYRKINAKETKTIHLDLTAKIQGCFLAPASSAYLYYHHEYKDWEKGVYVKIE